MSQVRQWLYWPYIGLCIYRPICGYLTMEHESKGVFLLGHLNKLVIGQAFVSFRLFEALRTYPQTDLQTVRPNYGRLWNSNFLRTIYLKSIEMLLLGPNRLGYLQLLTNQVYFKFSHIEATFNAIAQAYCFIGIAVYGTKCLFTYNEMPVPYIISVVKRVQLRELWLMQYMQVLCSLRRPKLANTYSLHSVKIRRNRIIRQSFPFVCNNLNIIYFGPSLLKLFFKFKYVIKCIWYSQPTWQMIVMFCVNQHFVLIGGRVKMCRVCFCLHSLPL